MEPLIGKRVAMHPATDDWMKGDRYGTIVRSSSKTKRVVILLDKSGKRRIADERDYVLTGDEEEDGWPADADQIIKHEE